MQLDELLQALSEEEPFQAVFSSPNAKSAEVKRIDLRPVFIRAKLQFQATFHYKSKNTHENLSTAQVKPFIERLLTNEFKQAVIFTSKGDYHVLISSKGKMTILKKKPLKVIEPVSHNRVKNVVLQEGQPIPFLVELGVMNKEGKVLASKQDKFRQINRFLEIISDVLGAFEPTEKIHIVDFGCGKSYLTFALYHYLVNEQKRNVTIAGLDLKADVIEFCNKVAKKLGYAELEFSVGDIAGYKSEKKIGMVVSLHACDTATDAALAQAIGWKAKVILAVPCCQHELYKQICNDDMGSLLKHGILKERFAALATDAARASLLEIAGYKTQVMEFIDMDHTPKNLLIRAVRRSEGESGNPKAVEEFQNFKELLSFNCALERMLKR